MTDQPESQSSETTAPGPEQLPPASESVASDGTGPSFSDRVSGHAQRVTDQAQRASNRATTVANERPELAIGAAFAGGFVLAQILKRLGD